MIALDASVLIAHLSARDAHHRAATAILLDAAPDSMLVHPLTLSEVLVGGARVGRGVAMLEDLQATGIRVTEVDDAQPLRLAELRAESTLKLPGLLRPGCGAAPPRCPGHL